MAAWLNSFINTQFHPFLDEALMPLEFIDIGANLTHASFSEDLPQVLKRAQVQGVVSQIITGVSLEGSEQAIKLCEEYAEYNLFATVGVHPHEARTFNTNTHMQLAELIQHPKVKAIGEMGLDNHRDYSTPVQQRYAFEQQLELAANCQLPLFIHEREAYPELYTLLKSCRSDVAEIVVHCFTGEQQALFNYLDLDCHIGITGWICDERRGAHLYELVPNIPLHRLMIETDAPYLIPRDFKKKPNNNRNEPQYLPHIAEKIACCYQKPIAEIAQATTATARKFFRI